MLILNNLLKKLGSLVLLKNTLFFSLLYLVLFETEKIKSNFINIFQINFAR